MSDEEIIPTKDEVAVAVADAAVQLDLQKGEQVAVDKFGAPLLDDLGAPQKANPVRRMAVLAEDGTKINGIIMQDPIDPDYWPGYGSYLVDEGTHHVKEAIAPLTTKSNVAPIITIDWPDWPPARFEIGDVLELKTGVITPGKDQLVQVTDDQGNTITVNKSANCDIQLHNYPPKPLGIYL